MKVRTVLGAAAILLAATAFAQAPVPIVERITTQRDITTRVTVFSNRTVVVSIRELEVQGFLRLFTVPEDSYMVYLAAFQLAAEELERAPISSDVDTSTAQVELTLYVGPGAPRTFEFSPMASVSLPLSRVMGAVNDLEQQARDASPSAFELSTWEPKRGDRVQLMNGTFARVVELLDGGLLVLEYEETYIREMVPPDRYADVILHVVDEEQ